MIKDSMLKYGSGRVFLLFRSHMTLKIEVELKEKCTLLASVFERHCLALGERVPPLSKQNVFVALCALSQPKLPKSRFLLLNGMVIVELCVVLRIP